MENYYPGLDTAPSQREFARSPAARCFPRSVPVLCRQVLRAPALGDKLEGTGWAVVASERVLFLAC